jgi:MFS family permease
MSEVLGRRIPLFAGFALFAIFQIPVAVAQNVATICVGRFLSGFFAAAPLSVVGGALADLWDPIPRAYAICIFAAGGFAGPVAGPIAGGFITESSLGWRWTSWITLIMAGFFGGVGFLIIPETSAARILQLRAAKLRKETGNPAIHAKADETKLTMNTVVTVYLVRPFKMFIQEPILALVTAYMSFLYGIVYLLFEAVSSHHTLPSLNQQLRRSIITHAASAIASSPFESLADKLLVPSIIPRPARLVPWCLPAAIRRLYRWNPHGCWYHCVLNRHELHARLRQARKVYS